MYIDKKYLPDDVELRDPAHLREEEVRNLLDFWMKRQKKHPDGPVVRFKAYRDSKGKACRAASEANTRPSRGSRDRRPSGAMSTRTKKGKGKATAASALENEGSDGSDGGTDSVRGHVEGRESDGESYDDEVRRNRAWVQETLRNNTVDVPSVSAAKGGEKSTKGKEPAVSETDKSKSAKKVSMIQSSAPTMPINGSHCEQRSRKKAVSMEKESDVDGDSADDVPQFCT